ncbi:MAG: hypothetical protein QNJ00_17045 [Woeseiaceae bacterium]|nr:hypothetical protein [Woeseiaceae bacterium]
MVIRIAIGAILVLVAVVAYMAANMLFGWGGLKFLAPSKEERLQATAYQFGYDTPKFVGDRVVLRNVYVSDGGIKFEYELVCLFENCARQMLEEINLIEANRKDTCTTPQLRSLLEIDGVFLEMIYLNGIGETIGNDRIDQSACEGLPVAETTA